MNENKILGSNRLPGSEKLTRPEEIKSMSKYLKAIRETYEENTNLDTRLDGIPGKTTGRIPGISELPTDYTKTPGKSPGITLSNYIGHLEIPEKNPPENLFDKILRLDTSSIEPRLENTRVDIDDQRKIDLNSEKILLDDGDKNIELPTSSITLDDPRENKLEKDLINLDLSEEEKNIALSVYKELLEKSDTEKVDLSNTRLDLQASKDISLSKTIVELESQEDIDLEETRIDINSREDVNLEDTRLDLQDDRNLNLDETKLDLQDTRDIDLDETRIDINSVEDVNLGETRLDLQDTRDIDLDETRIDINSMKDVNLEETRLDLQDDRNLNLDETKLDLQDTRDIDLEETRLDLQDTRKNELVENYSARPISKTEDTPDSLDETIIPGIDVKYKDPSLSEVILGLNDIPETENLDKAEIKLPEELQDTTLDEIRLDLQDTRNLELDNTRINIDSPEDVDLEETRLDIQDTQENKLDKTRINISPLKDVNLEETRLDLHDTQENELDKTRLDLQNTKENKLQDEVILGLSNKGGEIDNKLTADSIKLGGIVKDIDKLGETKVDLEDTRKNSLEDFIDSLEDPRDNSLEDFIDSIEDSRDNSLENFIDSLEDPRDNKLDDKVIQRPEEVLDSSYRYTQRFESYEGIPWTGRLEDTEYFGVEGLYDEILEVPPDENDDLNGLPEDTTKPVRDLDYLESTTKELFSFRKNYKTYRLKEQLDEENYYSQTEGNHHYGNADGIEGVNIDNPFDDRSDDNKFQTFSNRPGDKNKFQIGKDSSSSKDPTLQEYIRSLSDQEAYTKALDIAREGKKASPEMANWFSKISSLISAYFSSPQMSPQRAFDYMSKVSENLIKFREDFNPSVNVDSSGRFYYNIPSYQLTKNGSILDSLNINEYIRWLAEKTIGGNLQPQVRRLLLDETLAALVLARDQAEKLAKVNRDRLPGNDSGLITAAAQGGVSGAIDKAIGSLKKSASQLFSGASGVDHTNPMNRPETEVTGQPKDTGIGITKFEKTNDRDSKELKKSGLKGALKNLVKSTIGGSSGDYILLYEEYLNSKSFKRTLKDLCPGEWDVATLEDLRTVLESSPYITTPAKFGTLMKGRYLTQSLDTNTYWEIVMSPFVSPEMNGGWSFLPAIWEINLENFKDHGYLTAYSSWVPINSFELQKSKSTSKQLSLYDGEIFYPVGTEFLNELRITIVDDSFKSWRRYFEKCMKVSVYNSEAHRAPYYAQDSENYSGLTPTAIDESNLCIALYKNITFEFEIYIMNPQYNQIKKYHLLGVLKDFTEESVGEIDSGGTDLNVSFSIVGENPSQTALQVIKSNNEAKATGIKNFDELAKQKKKNSSNNNLIKLL